jgi:hypothetical protein
MVTALYAKGTTVNENSITCGSSLCIFFFFFLVAFYLCTQQNGNAADNTLTLREVLRKHFPHEFHLEQSHRHVYF